MTHLCSSVFICGSKVFLASALCALCGWQRLSSLAKADDWRAKAPIWRANGTIWRADGTVWRAKANIWRADAAHFRPFCPVLYDAGPEHSQYTTEGLSLAVKIGQSRPFCQIPKDFGEWRAKKTITRRTPAAHLRTPTRVPRHGGPESTGEGFRFAIFGLRFNS